MSSEEVQVCPRCKTKDKVEKVKGCRCMSCPDYICRNCPEPSYGFYEFYAYCQTCFLDYYDCECPDDDE